MDEWLSTRGWGVYVKVFRAHGITLSDLPALTDSDLRELGLTIGDRKRFLAAVNDRPFVRSASRTGERRPMTIVFIDLVGSSNLAEQIDPEQLLEVYSQYRAFCAVPIRRFGGTIAHFTGDGILAYFCYPLAHENDPDRAVRACLSIVSKIDGVKTPAPSPLQVRIGIARGLVVISDINADGLNKHPFVGSAPDRAAVGSTPNLAARLQTLSPPNGIVLSSETYARVKGRFECRQMADVALKGFARVHTPWQVITERPRASRDLPQPPRLAQFRGRDAEVHQLRQAWKEAKAGAGSALLVLAPAGFGKSRLIEEMLEGAVGSGASVVHFSAAPLDVDNPLYPFKLDLALVAGIARDDEPETALRKLETVLHGDAAARERALPLLASMLDLSVNITEPISMKPETRRELTIAVLVQQLLEPTRSLPTCLIFEDLHWLDPSSLDVLGRLIDEASSYRLLLLMTAREEFKQPWSDPGRAQVLRLAPLSRLAVQAMIEEIFVPRPVPARLLRHLADKTGGIPLFAEELARELLQYERLPDEEFVDDVIPASLHESLTARLDHLGPTKELAQIAAVIGMNVRTDVLREVSGDPLVEEQIDALVEAGLLSPVANGSVAFAHALVRDAAYGSLLRETRTVLHARAAAVLEQLDPFLPTRQPELLAPHLAASGDFDRAAHLWTAAARNALQKAALTEASRMLRRALTLLKGASPEPRRLQRQLEIMALLGPVLIATKGSKAQETQALYDDGLEIAAHLSANSANFPILWGWWRVSPDFNAHLERSKILLERAKREANPEHLLQAHHCCWASHYHAGNLERSAKHVWAGLTIYNAGDHRHHARLYGNHDAKSCAHGELARMLWMRGCLWQSAEHDRMSIDWARGLDHIGSLIHALDSSLFVQVYRRDLSMARSRADELVRFTSKHEITDHGASGHIIHGWCDAIEGDPSGLRRLEEGVARHRAVATYEDFPVYVCILAEALIVHGRLERAEAELARERTEFERVGIEIWRSEVLRMQAKVTLALGEVNQAVLLLSQAEEFAQRQGAPMLALRVAIERAEMSHITNERFPAVEALQRAIAAIPEPDDTADFRLAQSVLTILKS